MGHMLHRASPSPQSERTVQTMANQPEIKTGIVEIKKDVIRDYSPHLNPVHVATAPSLLSRIAPKLALSSSEARNQKRQLEGRRTTIPLDFTGFKHLAMLLLVMGNIKVMCVDWNQFGFWVALNHFGLGCRDLKMALLICGSNLLFLPMSLVVERIAACTLPKAMKKGSGAGNDSVGSSNANSDASSHSSLSSSHSSLSSSHSNTHSSRINAKSSRMSATDDVDANNAQVSGLVDIVSESAHIGTMDSTIPENDTEVTDDTGNSINKLVLFVTSFSHIMLSVVCLGGGSLLTWNLVDHPLIATGCEANVIITFLKLVSYALTNRELRLAKAHKRPFPEFYAAGPQYPENLSLSNLGYFWVAPCLVYQPVYPMRPEVRWNRVFPLLGELFTGMILIWVLMMQMAMPVIEHLVNNLDSWKMVIEDYLTLASVSITIWLVGFVALFQSMLNLVAEATRFADRDFYGDWWNAGSVGTFWRDWNRPISNYFRRHIYIPLRTKGASQGIASNVVFFVSALLHELLFGVATHNFNGVAFLCMIVQPIFIMLTAPLEKKRGSGTTVGNCVFWVSILFGQPTATVIYYLEWVSRHPTSKTSTTWWTSKFYSLQ